MIGYLYRVIESKSPTMPVGKMFWTSTKVHDNRTKEKTVELSDVDCNDYVLKLVKTRTKRENHE